MLFWYRMQCIEMYTIVATLRHPRFPHALYVLTLLLNRKEHSLESNGTFLTPNLHERSWLPLLRTRNEAKAAAVNNIISPGGRERAARW